MANPQSPKPDPDDLWPACDEQPPGVSIRPLSHGDLQALLAHLDTTTSTTTRTRASWPGRSGGGRPQTGRWWRCGCGPASAAPAPPPTPNIGADGPPNAPAGPTACPGGPPRCWPPA